MSFRTSPLGEVHLRPKRGEACPEECLLIAASFPGGPRTSLMCRQLREATHQEEPWSRPSRKGAARSGGCHFPLAD